MSTFKRAGAEVQTDRCTQSAVGGNCPLRVNLWCPRLLRTHSSGRGGQAGRQLPSYFLHWPKEAVLIGQYLSRFFSWIPNLDQRICMEFMWHSSPCLHRGPGTSLNLTVACSFLADGTNSDKSYAVSIAYSF